MNRNQIFCNVIFRINICILYKSLWILLKENNKLKNATILFLREKHNHASNFCCGASNLILNDSPFNFGGYTPT